MQEKEYYITPEMEIMEFDNEDVITTSYGEPIIGEDGLPYICEINNGS